jgi:hypothetical protein
MARKPRAGRSADYKEEDVNTEVDRSELVRRHEGSNRSGNCAHTQTLTDTFVNTNESEMLLCTNRCASGNAD